MCALKIHIVLSCTLKEHVTGWLIAIDPVDRVSS